MIKNYLPVLCGLLLSAATTAQCPLIAGIMVNACGTENNNEFIYLRTGSTAVNVNDLVIQLPTNGSITLANTNDFSPPAVTSITPLGACITVLDDGSVIPANAAVAIFMSNNVSQQYDFTSWCTQFGAVYLLYRNVAAPTTPTYLNTSPTPLQRTTNLSINGQPACTAAFTYNAPTTSVDGDFYQFPSPVAGVSIAPAPSNNGCASPPFNLLPLRLKSFTARTINDVVSLQWTTSQEQQTNYFEPEKSKDGRQFTAIGRVAAAGNSDFELAYTFEDKEPVSAPVYYRLRMVDLDGAAEYSTTVRVVSPADGFRITAVSPNPAANELVTAWNAATRSQTTLLVRDMNGKALLRKVVNSARGYNLVRIPVQALASGIYFLSLVNEQQVLTEKFIKR